VNLAEADARARLAAARVARLATADAAGRPHLVPVTFATVGDSLVTAVDHKPKRGTDLRRLRNIRAQPRVAVLADHYEEAWTALWWVRADGAARILEANAGGEERAAALRALVAKYPQYRERPPAGPVIWVDVDAWSGWAWGAMGESLKRG